MILGELGFNYKIAFGKNTNLNFHAKNRTFFCLKSYFFFKHLILGELVGVARLTEKPKNRTEISKTEPNRNRNLEIFQKPNRTETEVINRG